jgi:phage protein D
VAETPALYAARPALELDERDQPELAGGVLSLFVEETTQGLARCEVTFGNWGSADGGVDYLHLDRQLLDFGTALRIRLGEGDRAATVFDGRIAGLEAHYPETRPPELVALAEDRLQDLRMTRRTRAFEDLTDGEVIERVASDHGLRSEVDVDGPTRQLIAQVNQSDLAFVRERAQAVDAEIWAEGATLHAQARSRRDAGTVSLTYGKALRELSVLADVATQRTSVSVTGWDVDAKDPIEHEATASAIQPELNGDAGGAALLEQAFGARPERLVHTVPLTGQEAQALADARFRMQARRFVTASGTVEGDGRVRVGATLELLGLGPLFSGPYYAVEVRHAFDSRLGFLTHFRAERAGLAEE